MDFSLSEEQRALRDLARRIFREHANSEPPALWRELSKAELLGLAMPPEAGGAGLGFFEVALLLEEAGAAGALVPLHPTLVLGALPIAAFGSDEQKLRMLRPVASGEHVLSAALVHGADGVSAISSGGGFRLEGSCECVPALPLAARVLVPATDDDGNAGVFIVDPRAAGARVEAQLPTNEEPMGRLELDDVRVEASDVLAAPDRGQPVLDFMLEHARAGLCALALGVAERALELTARYATERHQFDRPIGTFQAVSQRAADGYIDVEAMRLTTWRAAWLLNEGRPAAREVAIAKLVAAEAGHRVVNAAQHIHGGIGFDRSYPLYRYFLWERQIEFTLGSAARELSRLGAMIAAGD
jgi:alkylation response protein AidB-like acyl-CoA dehydrogenase